MKRESMNSRRKSEKSSQTHGKHVIVLGAGASASSGYPVGEELRKLLINPERLREKLKEQLRNKYDELESDLDYSLKALDQSIRLFRNGGFATVDEFVRLTGKHRAPAANRLGRLLSLCFAIENPETRFKQPDYDLPDYYPFIQRLFEGDLLSLRADVAVLTFNYDPYLEFLLRRAYETRCEAKSKAPSDVVLDAILSGFQSRLITKLAEPGAFCLLKLHGTCALPSSAKQNEPCPAHEELFSADPLVRLRTVVSNRFADVGFPPIFFPWEIINRGGGFISKEKFRWPDQRQTASEVELFPLFKTIWERARREVQDAAKLSFVGLSMHDYLRPGFHFLLKNKSCDAQVVVADIKPQKPAERLERWLREFCPDRQWKVRVRPSFAEFIQEEMEPLRSQSNRASRSAIN